MLLGSRRIRDSESAIQQTWGIGSLTNSIDAGLRFLPGLQLNPGFLLNQNMRGTYREAAGIAAAGVVRAAVFVYTPPFGVFTERLSAQGTRLYLMPVIFRQTDLHLVVEPSPYHLLTT